MKLTADRVLAALPLIDTIISEKRPLTVKGAYRVARLHAKLLPEFRLLEERRAELIKGYGHETVPEGSTDPVPTVPADKVGEFMSQWIEVLREELEIDVQPLPLSTLGPATAESPVSAAEMLTLGELLFDDSEPLAEAA